MELTFLKIYSIFRELNILIQDVTIRMEFPSPVVRTLIPLQGTTGLIPGQGTKMLHVTQSGQKKKVLPLEKLYPRVKGTQDLCYFLQLHANL